MTRIVGGLAGGAKLHVPGPGTRPTSERVREAIFNRLAPWFAPGERPRVLDLFAGSGSLGIEALSRGAAFARFVERGREAGATLSRNLSDLGLAEHGELLATDALSVAARDGGPWDVVFYDPPYPLLDGGDERDAVLDALAATVRGALADDGVVVFHAPAGSVPAADLPGDLEAALKTYGTTDIWFVGRGE